MNRKRHIIIFVDAHTFDAEYQGTQTYIKEMYLKILDLHREIIVYFGATDIVNIENIFGHFNNARFVQYKSKRTFNRIFIEIPRIIDKLQCTHAHFQYVIPFKKNQHCRYVVTMHDILFNDFPQEFSYLYRLQRNFIFKYSAKRSDVLLTVSDYSKNKIAKRYNIKQNSIFVTPNAVSNMLYNFESSKVDSRLFISEKYAIDNYILYVSRIEPRKNQTLLLQAFLANELWKQDLHLVMVGSITLKSELFNMLKNMNSEIKRNIHWYNQVDLLDLIHFFNAAEYFVYPSKAEGFGIPPLEAAALCTPVLCSNVTAMCDFEFFDPYMFNPNNYDELNLKLLDMNINYKSIDTAHIKSTLMERYSWEKSASIFIDKVINHEG